MASAYEELLADALAQMGPTSLMRMRYDAEAMFDKHPVQVEDIPEPGTKDAAIREYNHCHNPKGEEGPGQFCATGPMEHMPPGFLEGSLIKAPLYHGTDRDVSKGLSPNLGAEHGIFLSPSRRYAGGYGSNLHKVLVNVQRPYIVEGKYAISPKDLTPADAARLQAQGYDSVVVSHNGQLSGAQEVVVFDPAKAYLIKEARVREFNDCNLPGGAPDGGRFGANADPRCGTSPGTVAQDQPSLFQRNIERLRKEKAATKAASDAELATQEIPLETTREGVLADVFRTLDPESRAKMLRWSFAEGHPPRESLMVMDPVTGGPVDLGRLIQGNNEDHFISSVEDLARSEANEDLLRSEDAHGLKRAELYDRTSAALAEGVLLGVHHAVPMSHEIRDAGITFHTHPSSRTFSMADVEIATRSPHRALGVLGRDGSEYALRVNDTFKVSEGTRQAGEEVLRHASIVTASILTGRAQRRGEYDHAFLDAGRAAATAKGWDIQEVNASIHGMMLTGVYRAMQDQGWLEYGEKVSAARQAEYTLHTNGQAERIAETVRTALTNRWASRSRHGWIVTADLVQSILRGGRQQGSGVGVSASAKEAAAALKDAAWTALVEFNKCHNPAGEGGGQFCNTAGIHSKAEHMDAWAISKGFASMADFYDKRLGKTGPEDPKANAIPYEEFRGHEKAWERMVDRAIALGVVDPAGAEKIGHYADGNVSVGGGYKPLPPELFHVATASTAIMQTGLRSREELGQMSGTGLGGGEDTSISFTADLKTARAIRQAMLEAHDVATGKLTVERLIQMAKESDPHLRARGQKGDKSLWGDQSFYKGFMQMVGGGANWKEGDPLPTRLQHHLTGASGIRALEQEDRDRLIPLLTGVGAASGWVAEDALRPVLPPEYVITKVTEDPHIASGRRMVWLDNIKRYATPQEKRREAFDIYKTWAFARDAAGGKLDPLFFSSDPDALAKVPRREIRILQFKPRTPKSKGYQVSSLGEWRVKTGDAVKFTGIVESRQPLREDNDCHNPAGNEHGGEFCGDGIPEHFPGKPWRKIDTPVKRFEYELDIKTEEISSNSEWSYLETPKGRATFLMKDLYASTDDKVELHWLLAEKRGAGRAAMERIVALADKHGITLGLWAQPLAGFGENEGFSLSKPRLEAFYAGFGFTRKRREDATSWMERKPKKVLREFNPCHEPAGENGGQFTFRGTGNCDAEGQPTFAPSRKARVEVKLHGHNPEYTYEPEIAKAVLGDHDPKALVREMIQYFDEPFTGLRLGTSSMRGEPYVRVHASAASGTWFTRVFKRHTDGTLSVHHEHFENHGAAEQGKALMQGQMEVYEKLGVTTIETTANISTGAYAWARYGFTATNPDVFAYTIRERMSTIHDPGNPLEARSKALQAAGIAVAGVRYSSGQRAALAPYRAQIEAALATVDPMTPWKVADLRIEGSAAELAPLVRAFAVRGNEVFNLSVKQGTRWNLQMRAEQQQGFFNLGRALLTGLSWDAKLGLSDKTAMKRLRAYLRG